jgi:hypothetical protein
MVTGSTPSSYVKEGVLICRAPSLKIGQFSSGQTKVLTAVLQSTTRVVPLQAFFDLVKFLLGKPYPKSKESFLHGTEHYPHLP